MNSSKTYDLSVSKCLSTRSMLRRSLASSSESNSEHPPEWHSRSDSSSEENSITWPMIAPSFISLAASPTLTGSTSDCQWPALASCCFVPLEPASGSTRSARGSWPGRTGCRQRPTSSRALAEGEPSPPPRLARSCFRRSRPLLSLRCQWCCRRRSVSTCR